MFPILTCLHILSHVLTYQAQGNKKDWKREAEQEAGFYGNVKRLPIILYEWLLQNFAEPGQRILDTHGGSMSHAIAAHKLGFDLTIIEKGPVYYEQAKKRLIEFQRQQVLF